MVDGTLYGASFSGGRGGSGTIFALTPKPSSVQERVVYSFNAGKNSDGSNPFTALTAMKGPNGDTLLYGGAFNGGKNAGGTIFAASTSGSEKTIYDTTGDTRMQGALTAVGSTLYGATPDGSTPGGAIFSLTAGGNYGVLHNFSDAPEGTWPAGYLSERGGLLFGTAAYGGSYGDGTIFEMTATGKMRVLYSFPAAAAAPYCFAPLLFQASDPDTIYGVTTAGGKAGWGTVFSFDVKTRKIRLIYEFGGGADGRQPSGNIVINDGTLYGTTVEGGAGSCTVSGKAVGCGTIFAVDLDSGKERQLHAFGGDVDGSYPFGVSLVSNTLYGTTYSGGTHGNGTAFRVNL